MSQQPLVLPPAIADLLRRMDTLVGGGEAYLTGGAARDLFLGRPLTDLDLAIQGDPLAAAASLADGLGDAFVSLHPQRGIARVSLPAGEVVDHIDVTGFASDVTEDLARRDFTINAVALCLSDLASASREPRIVDPFAGLADLEARRLRLVSQDALSADPGRLLRAVRLGAELDFRFEEVTAGLIRGQAARLAQVAPERQRQELLRILATPRAGAALQLMDDLGLLAVLLPEVTAGRGVEQPKEHFWDVLGHSLMTVATLDILLADDEPSDSDAARLWRSLWGQVGGYPGVREQFGGATESGRMRRALVKLAGLLHDIAKPQTKTLEKSGRTRFFGHAELGAAMAEAILGRLRFSLDEARLVSTIVREHLRPGQLSQGEPPTRRALYRFFRDTGDGAVGVLFLNLADHLAARGPRLSEEDWQAHVAYIGYLLQQRDQEEGLATPSRLVSGHDIMAALDIGPGALVGQLLEAVREAQAVGEVATREEALDLVRRCYHSRAKVSETAASGGGR